MERRGYSPWEVPKPISYRPKERVITLIKMLSSLHRWYVRLQIETVFVYMTLAQFRLNYTDLIKGRYTRVLSAECQTNIIGFHATQLQLRSIDTTLRAVTRGLLQYRPRGKGDTIAADKQALQTGKLLFLHLLPCLFGNFSFSGFSKARTWMTLRNPSKL